MNECTLILLIIKNSIFLQIKFNPFMNVFLVLVKCYKYTVNKILFCDGVSYGICVMGYTLSIVYQFT